MPSQLQRVSNLLVRTERVAKRALHAAIKAAKRNKTVELDQVVIALHAKLVSNTRAIRLLCADGEGNAAFGLQRASIEAIVHLAGITHEPAPAVDALRKYLSKAEGTIAPDASRYLDVHGDNPSALLATLFAAWCARQDQKAANDAKQSKHLKMKGVEHAAAISEAIEAEWEARLGPTLWSAIDQKHWHPAGYGKGGNSTKAVFIALDLESSYLVPFRQASKALHAGDYEDYINQHLSRVRRPRDAFITAKAQEMLCASTNLLCNQYGLDAIADTNRSLYRQGEVVRSVLK